MNVLWFEAQPALYTEAGLGLLVVEVSDRNQFYLSYLSAGEGMEHRADAFITPIIAIFYYLRLPFV